MARKPSTSAKRRAARQRARERAITLPMGLAFLSGSAALGAMVTVAALDVTAMAQHPTQAASALGLGALMAFGCAVVGALCIWEARP